MRESITLLVCAVETQNAKLPYFTITQYTAYTANPHYVARTLLTLTCH